MFDCRKIVYGVAIAAAFALPAYAAQTAPAQATNTYTTVAESNGLMGMSRGGTVTDASAPMSEKASVVHYDPQAILHSYGADRE